MRRLTILIVLAAILAACSAGPRVPAPAAGPTPLVTVPPGPPGVLLIYTRTGGFPDYCDELTVLDSGAARYRDTCRSSTRESALQPSDLAYLQALAAQAGRVRYTPNRSGDAPALELTFYGRAAGLPDGAAQARLFDIAQTANDSLRAALAGITPTPAASLEAVTTALALAQGDRSALRDAISDYLDLPEVRALSDADAAIVLQGLLTRAQVYPGTAPAVEVRRFGDNGAFALVNHPAPTITLYSPAGWMPLSEGTHIADLRLAGDRLAVITSYEGDRAVSQLALLAPGDAGWAPLWTSAGQREWIVADGGAAFEGAGIERVSVAGLTLSPLPGEEDAPIQECAMLCPRRYLSATWTLDAARQAYTRATTLGPGASFAEVLWDMTIRDEYAVTYEFLRRLRAGDAPGAQALATGEDVLTAAASLGLDQRELEVNGARYRLVFSASRPDSGLVRLRPFGLTTAPDGRTTQVEFQGTFTVTLAPSGEEWRVAGITR